MTRPRLVIAEDHAPTRESLRQALDADFDIVALVGDGQAAVEAVMRLQPDLVLLDISMPRLSGVAALQRMKQRALAAKVVFVTGHDDPAYVEEAFRTGANGYVLKHDLAVEVPAAVREVLAGGCYRSPAIG